MKIDQKTVDDVALTLPDEMREPVRWLYGYMVQVCGNSRVRLSARFTQVGHPYDQSYIFKLFTGQLINPKTGKIGEKQMLNWLDAIEALRSAEKGPLAGRGIPPVETEVVRMVRDAIDAVRRPERISKWLFISAPTGRQKSYATAWYQSEHNHTSTYRLEAPARPVAAHLVAELSEAVCHTSADLYYERIANIRANLNGTKCVIIDNAQRLYNPRGGNRQDCFSTLQKLQDEIGFSLVLIFVRDVFIMNGKKQSSDFIDDMTNGDASGYFSQLIGRIGGLENVLRLPDETCDEDLLAFAKTVGMTEPGAKLCLPILRHLDRSTGNIRVLLQTLQNAADMARANEQKEINPLDLCEVVPTDKLDSVQRERLEALINKIREKQEA